MSATFAALDSLAATLVPKLPAASQVALQKTAHYYAVQAACVDAGLLLFSVICFALLKVWLIPGYKKANESGIYDAETPWIAGLVSASIVGTILGIAGIILTLGDIPFFLDPVTGTILRLLGK